MFLYHYTWSRHLHGILKGGLKVGAASNNAVTCPPMGVIWLTTESELDTVTGWALRPFECRIKLVVPSTDKRLVKWSRWLRKHQPSLIDALRRCDCGRDHIPSLKEHWVYFGDVPLSMFRAIEGQP
jgi:hypothetical protein